MNYQVMAASGLKIRSGPGIDCEEIGTLANGEVVISPTEENGFIPILLEDDTLGYVAKEFVQPAVEDSREIEAIETAPVETALPIYQKDLVAKYGYPKERAGYLVTIDLREFAQHFGQVKDFQGHPWSGRIYGHEALAVPLKRAFAALVAAGLAGELRTYDGCFNIRRMTSGKSYSVHSWGLALDLNAAENPYGGQVNFSDEFILCFAQAGFEAGALWSTPDGMHFQLPWTRDWQGSDVELRPRL